MLINSNSLAIPLATGSVHCVVTSPPYWSLRDYGVSGQLGLESTPEAYVQNMVAVFREVWRVMRDDGTLWLNLGDSYASGTKGSGGPTEKQASNSGSFYDSRQYDLGGLKPKDLVGIPWRVAFALQADGWYLRSDIIWSKPNPMPESVTDRPTKAHEYMFLLSKSARYFFDAEAVKEPGSDSTIQRWGTSTPQRKNASPQGMKAGSVNGESCMGISPSGRNIRTVWNIPTAPTPYAHFATYPPRLVTPCIKAGTSEKGVCPVCGAGWVRVVEKEARQEPYQYLSIGIPGEAINRGRRPGTMGNGLPIKNTGWRPSCSCPPADPIPATVFDPFAGSGTTLLVARKLGRRGVGCDLSYTYLHDIARRRLEIDDLDDWQDGNAMQAGGDLVGLPMFAEVL